jgi:hypothetical protein
MVSRHPRDHKDTCASASSPKRFVGTVRRECLDRLLFVNVRDLETVLIEYVAHLNTYRPHHSLDNCAPLQ